MWRHDTEWVVPADAAEYLTASKVVYAKPLVLRDGTTIDLNTAGVFATDDENDSERGGQ